MGFQIRGVAVPSFLYGTAWKEDATSRLSFEEIGYDSLAVMETTSRIEQELGVVLPESELEGTVTLDDIDYHTACVARGPFRTWAASAGR